ncbi:MAG: hypothetical protein KBG07_05660 [Elusimicrobia bacterium]|nr:hypothetical protein [Elusimicrobiota bacterium]
MSSGPTEKVAVAGLGRLAARILGGVGVLAGLKGVWDLTVGVPEAQFFSAVPWAMVSKSAWLRFGLFEFVFGVACMGLGRAVWIYSRRLPEWIERPVLPKNSSPR